MGRLDGKVAIVTGAGSASDARSRSGSCVKVRGCWPSIETGWRR